MNFTEAAFLTMSGLTGVLLTLVLVALALTSQPKFRALRFEIFSKIHTVGIVTWPILLFLHDSQGWVGISIPLVLVVCGLPILLYVSARLDQLLRYYLNSVSCVQLCARGLEKPKLKAPWCNWSSRAQGACGVGRGTPLSLA